MAAINLLFFESNVNFWLNLTTLIAMIVIVMTIRRARLEKASADGAEMAYRMQIVMGAIQKATNGVIVTDSNFRIVFWNTGAEQLLGWQEIEVIGKLVAITAIDVTDLSKKGTPIDATAMNKRGKILDVNITISETVINKIVHYTIIIKNIADRILIQRQHEQELSLYHDGERVGCVGFWSLSVSTNTVRVSEGFKELFETDADVEDLEYLLKRVYYEDKPAVHEAINNAIANKQSYEVEYRMIKLNGEVAWFRAHGRVYVRDNGTAEKVAGIIIKIDKQ